MVTRDTVLYLSIKLHRKDDQNYCISWTCKDFSIDYYMFNPFELVVWIIILLNVSYRFRIHSVLYKCSTCNGKKKKKKRKKKKKKKKKKESE